MSYLDNAMDIALFVLIFSASLSLLNNPAIGVGEELGVQKNVDAGPTRAELESEITQKRDFTPMPGLDYFFKLILAGWELMKIVIGIPFAIYTTITTIIPGAVGVAIATAFQLPADLIMAMGLARYFKR